MPINKYNVPKGILSYTHDVVSLFFKNCGIILSYVIIYS